MRKKEKKAKKKGGCLSKIILIVVILGVLGSFGESEPDNAVMPEATAAPTIAPTAKPTSVPTQAPTSTPEYEPTATPAPTPGKLVVPGIDGSQAYDVILSLEEQGISKPDTQTTKDGLFKWSSNLVIIGGAVVYYEIQANSKHEILSATFNMSGGDNDFLLFAATLPYAAADKEKAVQFVKDHMTGESASVTIGDAVFSIYPNEKNVMLTINDVESEKFYGKLLDQKLGL